MTETDREVNRQLSSLVVSVYLPGQRGHLFQETHKPRNIEQSFCVSTCTFYLECNVCDCSRTDKMREREVNFLLGVTMGRSHLSLKEPTFFHIMKMILTQSTIIMKYKID